jgi:hypothetical protein
VTSLFIARGSSDSIASSHPASSIAWQPRAITFLLSTVGVDMAMGTKWRGDLKVSPSLSLLFRLIEWAHSPSSIGSSDAVPVAGRPKGLGKPSRSLLVPRQTKLLDRLGFLPFAATRAI